MREKLKVDLEQMYDFEELKVGLENLEVRKISELQKGDYIILNGRLYRFYTFEFNKVVAYRNDGTCEYDIDRRCKDCDKVIYVNDNEHTDNIDISKVVYDKVNITSKGDLIYWKNKWQVVQGSGKYHVKLEDARLSYKGTSAVDMALIYFNSTDYLTIKNLERRIEQLTKDFKREKLARIEAERKLSDYRRGILK